MIQASSRFERRLNALYYFVFGPTGISKFLAPGEASGGPLGRGPCGGLARLASPVGLRETKQTSDH